MQEKAIKNSIFEKFASIENHNVMTSQEMNESIPSVLHTLHHTTCPATYSAPGSRHAIACCQGVQNVACTTHQHWAKLLSAIEHTFPFGASTMAGDSSSLLRAYG
jgi:hypothetical protein